MYTKCGAEKTMKWAILLYVAVVNVYECNIQSGSNMTGTDLYVNKPQSVPVIFEPRCITYLLTYSVVQSPSWEDNWFAASQEIPRISRNPKFIAALKSVRHLSLSWASPIQYIYPHSTSWRSILILSIHLRLGLPSGLLPSGFSTKTLYTPLSSPIRATYPAHLILLDFITHTILGEEYKSFNSSLCNLLNSPVTSSILGPNILLNTMFSNTISFLSFRNVNDQVSHPYKTTGKIIVLYIFIFKYFDSNLEDKRFCTEWERNILKHQN